MYLIHLTRPATADPQLQVCGPMMNRTQGSRYLWAPDFVGVHPKTWELTWEMDGFIILKYFKYALYICIYIPRIENVVGPLVPAFLPRNLRRRATSLTNRQVAWWAAGPMPSEELVQFTRTNIGCIWKCGYTMVCHKWQFSEGQGCLTRGTFRLHYFQTNPIDPQNWSFLFIDTPIWAANQFEPDLCSISLMGTCLPSASSCLVWTFGGEEP
jgi:hypothetical protein